MVTTELTTTNSDFVTGAGAALVVIALTGIGVGIGAVDHGLAAATHPHPTLTGTAPEAVAIFANNARVLVAPFALWALGFASSRAGRWAGDVIVLGLTAINTVYFGVELGRWGTQLAPYVPQLPLEWVALTIATAAWLEARTASTNRVHMARLACAVVALLASAAAVETWCTPLVRRPAIQDRGWTSRQLRPFVTAVESHPDFAPTTAQSLQGRRRLPSPHTRSVPLGRLVAADRADINHRPQ